MAAPDFWSPWIRIRTPKVLLPFVVTELVVHMQEGMHPLAQLTVRYHLPQTFQPVLRELPPALWWPEDTAVEISYGPRRSEAASFFGYVVSPELLNSGNELEIPGQMLDVRYTLLGASKPLQTARDRTWRTCTASYMATEIAAENGLLPVVSPHGRIFDVRQQTLQSDFAFLQDRARELGWRLVIDGTTLFFTNPHQPLSSRTPVFRKAGRAGKQDTLLSFAATVGQTDPAGAIRAEHQAVSVSTAGVVSTARSSDSAELRRYDQRHVAQSWTEAAQITEAAATRDLWWVHGRATVDGDVALAPGRVVRLGGEALTEQHTGEWMTRCARHRIALNLADRRASEYFVDLELGRNQEAGLTRTRPPVVPAADSALVQGRWVARRRPS